MVLEVSAFLSHRPRMPQTMSAAHRQRRLLLVARVACSLTPDVAQFFQLS